jgi:hypothetical protein
MKLSSIVACAAATATCATAVVLSGAPAAYAATTAIKPRTWTVEYKLGNELIFVTYDYPQQTKKQLLIPLVLNQKTTSQVSQQALGRDIRKYQVLPGDSVSVMVLMIPPAPPRQRLRPLFRIRWRHVRLETGFGGMASSVARHHPMP